MTLAMQSLALRVSADSWNGDPNFVVTVDGVQVGGVQTASASHAKGQWQDVTLTGNFDVDPSKVAVSFTNDAYGGSAAADRNLYVQSLTLGGTTYLGSALPATLGPAASDSAVMDSNGTITFNTAPQNTLTLRVAADSWNGDPNFVVTGNDVVDSIEGAGTGVVVAGTLSASLAAGDSLAITVGGVSTVVPTADITGTSFAVTVPKPATGWTAGTATAQVSDAAGNASASASQAYTVKAAPAGGMALVGVNLSGGEYSANTLPGLQGRDYTYPTDAEIDYYAAKGLNVIRLPFLWERVQPTEDGPLSASELSQLDSVIDYANAKGMKVILDPHNYGSGYGNLIGSAGTPTSAFADFWGKLAAHYASNGDVMFGLMNEPQQSTASAWLGDANAAIGAIRAAGATSQEILVPGTYWDGAWTWTSTDNASVIGTGIKDPNNNFVFEVHQYLDSDGSGTHTSVVSPTVGSSRLAAITQWAKTTGNKLFLGEFGVSPDSTSLSAMNDMLSFMNKNSDVWQGATDWAAGPWLGENIYTIEPTGLGTGSVTDRPQMGVLQKYAPGTF